MLSRELCRFREPLASTTIQAVAVGPASFPQKLILAAGSQALKAR